MDDEADRYGMCRSVCEFVEKGAVEYDNEYVEPKGKKDRTAE